MTDFINVDTEQDLEQVRQEVEHIISSRADKAELIEKEDVANAVVLKYYDLDSPSSGQRTLASCAYQLIVNMARRILNNARNTSVRETIQNRVQMSLEGFEKIQDYYAVERDGENVHVPLTKITKEELIEKAQMHEEQAAGHTQHAQEIRDLVGIMEDAGFFNK
jgi:hypothetical protein